MTHGTVAMDRRALAMATDLCVKCGLCLPDCPTYRLTQNEGESPRGRLALIQGWSEGRLQDSRALQLHIDHCLHCRSCEAVCPAKVPYGAIVDSFRDLSNTSPFRPKSTLRARVARWGLDRPVFRQITAPLLAPRAHDQRPPPPLTSPRATVGLFTGCTGDWLDSATRDAIVRLLHQLGIAVVIPPAALCCGAIDQHAGRMQAAAVKAEQTLSSFDWNRLDAVVHFASGCGAQLLESRAHTPNPAIRLMDIAHYLASQVPDDAWPVFRRLDATALLHTPCTLRNVLKEDAWPGKLLQRIPGLQVLSLPSKGQCCGAAGMHMLAYPDTADQLRQRLLAQQDTDAASLLLTSNPGCAMHFRKGLPRQVEVLHPVVLLARQLA
ncbi:MAG: hypothetical protein RIQ52_976 [Pseudomonadota bacterium]